MKRFISLSLLMLCISCVEIKSDQPSNADDRQESDPDATPIDQNKPGEDEEVGASTAGSKFQFTTCDKISASTKEGGKASQSATSFSSGEIITGVLDQDDPDANVHFWKIAIPKGEYIMVLEAEKANNKHGNIIFDVSLVDSETKEEKRLINLNEIGYDSRAAERFTAATDRSLILKVVSKHDIGTYKFAFFSPNTPIPQPRFGNCPETRPLVLGKKEVFEFPDIDGNSSLYLVGELEAGNYKINLKSFTTDNEKSNVGAKINQLAEAADEGDEKLIVNINEISLSEERSGTMLLAKKQIVVIRASTSFSDNGMELQIVKD